MRKIGLVLAVVLSACQPDDKGIHGYIEGDYIYIAPTTSGILQKLDVVRGQQVEKGASLFTLDRTGLMASLASAQAEQAKAQAAFVSDNADYNRLKTLVPLGAASQTDLDAKKALTESDTAQIKMAEQKIVQVQKQLSEASPKVPQSGRIEDTYFKSGEYINAGTPVASLLPPENVKIRFFVPQALLPQYLVGTKLSIQCDGCSSPIPARISYIASQSEYTPPVIYSVGSRDKLVFMVEAQPDVYSPTLRPGLPVDIERNVP